MGELAAQTNSSRSRISHAVRRLEAKGWLARIEVDHDKRGQYANLTEAGLAALRNVPHPRMLYAGAGPPLPMY